MTAEEFLARYNKELKALLAQHRGIERKIATITAKIEAVREIILAARTEPK